MRTVIVAGPRRGKSWLARELRAKGVPTFCGDPESLVKEPESGVTYLPEGLSWSDGSRYVAEVWFRMPGPWCCEGQIMARALRKWPPGPPPCDRVIVLRKAHPSAVVTPGQEAMAKGVWTVWTEIAARYAPIVELR